MHIDIEKYRALRHELHSHPELGLQEKHTAQRVSAHLEALMIETHRHIGGTGVVGVIRKGSSSRSIALRADMDALPISETSQLPYTSGNAGVMHACGHDGHTVMLLAAAEYLTRFVHFDGTVVLVFQPAEEGLGGAELMLRDGLLQRFPVEAIFGMHNWPGLAAGEFAVMPGPVMACADHFDIHINGTSTHAGLPHLGSDTILVGAHLVERLQAIISRQLSPFDTAVVSVTQFHAGSTYNILPSTATLSGTVRAFSNTVRDQIEQSMGRLCESLSEHGKVEVALEYRRDYAPTINSGQYVDTCRAAAADVVGRDKVSAVNAPSMAAEDFSVMLQARPGCYVWLGNGPTDNGQYLHSSCYDFNDEIIDIGARYWVRLVERLLPSQ